MGGAERILALRWPNTLITQFDDSIVSPLRPVWSPAVFFVEVPSRDVLFEDPQLGDCTSRLEQARANPVAPLFR